MIERTHPGLAPERPKTNQERLAEFRWKFWITRPVPFNDFQWKRAPRPHNFIARNEK